MSSAALSLPPPVDPALVGLYEGVDAPDVAHYLAAYPALVPVLVRAVPEVRRIFGADTRLLLLPQTEYGGATSLYAFIVADLDEAELDRRLARFDEEWWLGQLRAELGPVTFDVGRPA